MGIGFFKFLKELFNGTYFDNDNNNKSRADTDPVRFSISSGTSSSNAMSDSQVEDAIRNNQLSNASGIGGFLKSLSGLIPALVNRISAEHLTGAEREANAFSAEQAQIDRDFQERMSNTQYQRGVADMRAAGVNPALAMNNGGAAAPSGSTAAGVQPQGQAFNFSDLMQLMMLKPQIRLMEKQGQAVEAQGRAALATSEANTKNAETNRRSQIVDALLANNQIKIGDSIRQLNEAQMEEIAQRIRESASRMELQAVEKLAKELQYEFDSQTFEANKELVLQQLVYRAVEMSEMRSVIALNNELKENASKQGEILDADKVGAQLSAKWKEDNPRFYKFLEAAGMSTGVIGNILSGSFGWSSSRSKSRSNVDVNSNSRSVSDVTTHKGN